MDRGVRASAMAMWGVSGVLIAVGLAAFGAWVWDSFQDQPARVWVTVNPIEPSATAEPTQGWWEITPSPASTLTAGEIATATAEWSGGQPTATPTPVELKGKILFKTKRGRLVEIWYMDPDGSNQAEVPWGQRDAYYEALEANAYSADRQYVALVAGSTDIYLREVNTGSSWEVTRDTFPSYDPAMSPDGYWIAFVSEEPGQGADSETNNDELNVITRHGEERGQLTFHDWAWHKHPSWSPDGSQIVFHSNRTGTDQIYIINRDGAGMTQITFEGASWAPVWVRE